MFVPHCGTLPICILLEIFRISKNHSRTGCLIPGKFLPDNFGLHAKTEMYAAIVPFRPGPKGALAHLGQPGKISQPEEQLNGEMVRIT
jgi:hypothetical protein